MDLSNVAPFTSYLVLTRGFGYPIQLMDDVRPKRAIPESICA
jgi:hypothetical protein